MKQLDDPAEGMALSLLGMASLLTFFFLCAIFL